MDLSQLEQSDRVLQEFINQIKKDSDMPGLSLFEQQELQGRINRQNKKHNRRYIRLLIWSGSIAASICLFIIAGQHLFSPPQPVATIDYFSIMQSFSTEDDDSDNVQLVLPNNQIIAIEGHEAQLQYEEEGWVNINKNEKLAIVEHKEKEKAVYNQLIVPAGKRSMLTFNDGTRVWVNAGSKLVYPSCFEKNKREIFVEGEIYLDVSSNPEKPFIVRTNTFEVKVLGTQFNVSAYTDQSDMQVVLVSGAVEIRKNGISKEILKPNQIFSYNESRQDYSVSTIDVSDYIAWKEGYYPFNRQDLAAILAKLSKYYTVQFKWSEKIKELSCSGKLDLKENVQEVLSTLEKTAPIEIKKISEREYIVVVKP